MLLLPADLESVELALAAWASSAAGTSVLASLLLVEEAPDELVVVDVDVPEADGAEEAAGRNSFILLIFFAMESLISEEPCKYRKQFWL